MGSSFYGGNKNSFYGGSGFYGGGDFEPELTAIDKIPYNFRKTGGDIDVKKKAIKETVVGGTIAWNQQINKKTINYTSENLDVSSQNDGKWTATIRGSISASVNVTSMRGGAFPVGHKVLYLSGNDTVQVRYKTPNNIVTPKIVNIPSTWTNTSYNVRLDYPEGTTGTFDLYPVAFDLTQMFGATIANYIYSLEQTKTGDGVAWFKKLFPKDYYAYDTGTLQSVQTSAHKMVGFNAWDEEWESGSYAAATGIKTSDGVRIRSKNFIPVISGMVYYMTTKHTSRWFLYDAAKNYLGYTAVGNNIVTIGDNVRYITFSIGSSVDPVTTYDNDICINLSWDGEKDGTYEPYVEYSYPLDSSLELRGIPELDENNRLRYNGDTYESDGTVTRRYGIIDLGTLTWSMSTSVTSRFNSNTLADAYQGPAASLTEGMCSKYLPSTSAKIQTVSPDDQTFAIRTSSTPVLFIYDTNYTDAASLKAALSGVYFIYKLATPTTETADLYTNSQIIDPYGTEEYVDAGVAAGIRDVAIPVGHETIYKI